MRIINEWIEKRNQFPFKSVLVFPRSLFAECCKQLSELSDVAFISIEDYNGLPHLLTTADNVLNIEFDDCDVDDIAQDVKAITEAQGEEIGEFVSRHLDKHFIIHCTAGKSRSQGVARAILDSFPDIYQSNIFNCVNPCITPNYAVVSVVKRYFWFHDISAWKQLIQRTRVRRTALLERRMAFGTAADTTATVAVSSTRTGMPV